jgi:UDP-N-acetylmuramoyl-L-alanyl-D-glutamate--2,6-diaminopimelate ligase
MRLHELLRGLASSQGLPDVEVTGVTADSRGVEPGFLFIATRGRTADGHTFLPEAASRGAAVLAGEAPDLGLGLPYIRVSNGRRFLADVSAAWYGHPSRALIVCGVTGTDGKTTTGTLLHRILLHSGHPAGLITSVSAVVGDAALDTGFHVTTPDSPDVQRYLRDMVRAGSTHAVLEVTSHGLAQDRVAACEFDVGLVTNVTPEHLDYHGSFEAYLDAKARLFAGLGSGAAKPYPVDPAAILNRDDASFDRLRAVSRVRVVSYGESAESDLRAVDVTLDGEGIRFRAARRGDSTEIRSRLSGRYNVSNCLAAFTAAVEALRVSPQAAAEAIWMVEGIPGRMEAVDLGQPFQAIVDFAHTPHALCQALIAARQRTAGRVIVVFGCAGLRDTSKRRSMARSAVELADISLFTAEDPRTESLPAILAEMASGAQEGGGQEGRNYRLIPDRAEALRQAVRLAQPGDIVLACGKGHEQSMAFGEVEYPWDDRIALRAALAELLGVAGPAMPVLPTSS